MIDESSELPRVGMGERGRQIQQDAHYKPPFTYICGEAGKNLVQRVIANSSSLCIDVILGSQSPWSLFKNLLCGLETKALAKIGLYARSRKESNQERLKSLFQVLG